MAVELLDDLRVRLAIRDVSVLVGAGIAIGASLNQAASSWTGLLGLGVDRCVDVDPAYSSDWAKSRHLDIDVLFGRGVGGGGERDREGLRIANWRRVRAVASGDNRIPEVRKRRSDRCVGLIAITYYYH